MSALFYLHKSSVVNIKLTLKLSFYNYNITLL